MEDWVNHKKFKFPLSILIKLKLLNKILSDEGNNICDLIPLKNLLMVTLPFILLYHRSPDPRVQEITGSALYHVHHEMLKLIQENKALPQSLKTLMNDCHKELQKQAFPHDTVENTIQFCKEEAQIVFIEKLTACFSCKPKSMNIPPGISEVFLLICKRFNINPNKLLQEITQGKKKFLKLLKQFLSPDPTSSLNLNPRQLFGLIMAFVQNGLPLSESVYLKLINQAVLKTDPLAFSTENPFHNEPGKVMLDAERPLHPILMPREILKLPIVEIAELDEVTDDQKEKVLIYLLKRYFFCLCGCGKDNMPLIEYLQKMINGGASSHYKNALQIGSSLLALAYAIWSEDVPIDTLTLAFFNFFQEFIRFYQAHNAGKTWQGIQSLALKPVLLSRDYLKSSHTDYEALNFLFDIYNLLRKFHRMEETLPELNLKNFFSNEKKYGIWFSDIAFNPSSYNTATIKNIFFRKKPVNLPENTPEISRKSKNILAPFRRGRNGRKSGQSREEQQPLLTDFALPAKGKQSQAL